MPARAGYLYVRPQENIVNTSDSDLSLGRQVVRTLVDFSSNPPLVRREIQSVGRLHGELRFLGFSLFKVEQHGVEGGHQIFYTKGSVLVRVKTRGANLRTTKGVGGSTKSDRRGEPHLTVSLLSGKSVNGKLDTSYDEEHGKFHVGGGVVNKAPNSRSPIYDVQKSAAGQGTQDTWSDQTHFGFHGQALDDSGIDDLIASL
jgi:hypothetical protein